MNTQLKYGIISDTNPEKGLVRVAFGDDDDGDGNPFVSQWIPVLFSKTYSDKVTFPMDVQEHVVCMMDEYCENGIVLGSIYSNNESPDGAGADIHRTLYKDGSFVMFDRSTGKFTASFTGDADVTVGGNLKATVSGTTEIDSSGDITLNAPNVNFNGNINLTGDFSASGDVVAGGKVEASGDVKTLTGDVVAGLIHLKTHKHLGVTTGSGVSGTPTP